MANSHFLSTLDDIAFMFFKIILQGFFCSFKIDIATPDFFPYPFLQPVNVYVLWLIIVVYIRFDDLFLIDTVLKQEVLV